MVSDCTDVPELYEEVLQSKSKPLKSNEQLGTWGRRESPLLSRYYLVEMPIFQRRIMIIEMVNKQKKKYTAITSLQYVNW